MNCHPYLTQCSWDGLWIWTLILILILILRLGIYQSEASWNLLTAPCFLKRSALTPLHTHTHTLAIMTIINYFRKRLLTIFAVSAFFFFFFNLLLFLFLRSQQASAVLYFISNTHLKVLFRFVACWSDQSWNRSHLSCMCREVSARDLVVVVKFMTCPVFCLNVTTRCSADEQHIFCIVHRKQYSVVCFTPWPLCPTLSWLN